MNYKDSIDYLENIAVLGGRLGLESITRLLDKLSNPQHQLKVIHVAGTNGKGSISNLLKSILMAGNYSVGLYNSPSILSYRETISLNADTISEDDFAKIASKIEACCNQLLKEGHPQPTVFECTTALALDFFAANHVDIAIVEVGLGGALDATNVFTNPLVSVITTIGYDHTEFLGNTLKEISTAKAGIIKKKTPVVVAPNDEVVLDVIMDMASALEAPFYYNKLEDIMSTLHECTLHGMTFSMSTPYFSYTNLFTQLIGQHQLINISVALMTIHVLNMHYPYTISNMAITDGLAKTYWPCRCEYIEKPIKMLIDGAHNESSMECFAQVLSSHCISTPITYLFGVLKDKDVHMMLKKMAPFSNTIFITVPLSDRGLPTEKLIVIATDYFEHVYPIDKMDLALEAAIAHAKKTNTMLCCVGSLYLSVPVRNLLR
ncbi:MAG: hypothetical protein CVU84_07160 [Firmicutes bacterium HGW-Firmicutes-1]|jgi:dihydrofolate synthase/folylpolyglutamate synthase|nr:MAG: hypothetical protein CVU84_07160 [Firmicutes bacterium HGW-Firmicutes-1]